MRFSVGVTGWSHAGFWRRKVRSGSERQRMVVVEGKAGEREGLERVVRTRWTKEEGIGQTRR